MNTQVEYFELNGVPYAQFKDGDGSGYVFNCSIEPPEKVDDFQSLPNWTPISATIFNNLRNAYLAAAELQNRPSLEEWLEHNISNRLTRRIEDEEPRFDAGLF